VFHISILGGGLVTLFGSSAHQWNPTWQRDWFELHPPLSTYNGGFLSLEGGWA